MNESKRSRASIVLASLLALASATVPPSPLAAQSAGRAVVRGQEVTGLELGLEGGLSAPRGGSLRWLVTVYEVVGQRDLRPGSDARIELTSALARDAEPTVVHTDAHGRAELELPLPDTAPDRVPVTLVLRSRGVTRRFELTVSVQDSRALGLWFARTELPAGAPVHVLGRLHDPRSGRGITGEEVRLTLYDGAQRPVAPTVTVRSDASGVVSHVFPPSSSRPGALRVRAETRREERIAAAEAHATVRGDVAREELQVAVLPSRVVVSPGESVPVEIVARTATGRPVPGAHVEFFGPGVRPSEPLPTTDARGVARVTWTVPPSTAPLADLAVGARVTREGLGTGTSYAPMRAANVDYAAAVAVEGGALVPSLGGHVWVRVVGPEGHAAPAGVPVALTGARFATQEAVTDGSGVARITLPALRPAPTESSACGAEGSLAVTIRVGDGPRAARLERCLPIDEDGLVRVRLASSRVREGESLDVEIARTAAVSRADVVLSFFAVTAGERHALGSETLGSGRVATSFAVPPGITGQVLVRARPLGDGGRVLRGGSALAWVEAGEPLELAATLDASGITVSSAGGDGTGWAIALPRDEARALESRLGVGLRGPLGALTEQALGTGLLEGTLAAATPLDLEAPWVLREGRAEAVPVPENAIAVGLLRDPWRAQARFLSGRLALVFAALEEQVAQAVPGRIEEVAVPRGSRWTWNPQVMRTLEGHAGLGAEGATGLGGEPLTITELQQLDPSFSYDRVAARVTRERLFRLLVALRRYVQQNGFDLPWSRLGEPSAWLTQLPSQGTVRAQDLVDAWGRPFVLRPVRGRARFAAWAPVDGWELFSAGPDGREGTSDDLVDPTARVLASGTPYAQAVGEDWLVARLRGVDLGRVTIELLQRTTASASGVGEIPHLPGDAAQQQAGRLWHELPSELSPPSLVRSRPADPGRGAGGRAFALRRRTHLDLRAQLDESPRDWSALVVGFSPAGRVALARADARLGAPLLVEATLPARVRLGDAIELPVTLTNLDTESRTLSVELRADGLVEGSAPLSTLAAETSERVALAVRPLATGRTEAQLVVRDGECTLRTLRWSLAVDAGQHPLRTRAAGLVDERGWRTRLDVPSDASRATARVVFLTGRALHRDPDLAEARRRTPELVAWAATLAGAPLDPSLRTQLLAAEAPSGTHAGLDAAASVIALAALVDDRDASAALERARRRLLGGIGLHEAAQLAALASAAAGDLATEEERALDPVGAYVTRLQRSLRRTLRRSAEPTELARAAAALLLADPRDVYGRALYERAREHVEDAPSGGGALLRPSAPVAVHQVLGGTAALAIAAQLSGDAALAQRLLRGVLDRDHVLLREPGEALFWLLATGAYGVVDAGEAQPLTLTVGGRAHEVRFEGGVAIVPVEATAGRALEVQVAHAGGAPVVARAEVVLERPFQQVEGRSLLLELTGDVGTVADGAALELHLTARRPLLGGALVEVQLPAGVVVDERLSTALRATRAFAVEAREPGLLRIRVEALAEGVPVVLPMPLRWGEPGRRHGLAVIGYPTDDPGDMTVLPPRVLDVARGRVLE